MKREFNVTFCQITLLICALLFFQTPSMLFADTAADIGSQYNEPAEGTPMLTANRLDDLVAPIALYPDPLVSQILVASTYPIELVEAYQWLQRNPGLKGQALTDAAQEQNWDPSIQALLIFPDIIQRLNEDVRWTTSLGNAFLAQQADVMSAIQRMRLKAQQAGKLVSTPEQQVVTTPGASQTIVTIIPTNPELMYVPVYNPVWIWGPATYYAYPQWYFAPHAPALFFSAGVPVRSFLVGGWTGWAGWGWYPHWTSHTIVVNNAFIQRYHFNSVHLLAPTGTSVWVHDPIHRHGIPYRPPTLPQHFRAAIPQHVPAPLTRPQIPPSGYYRNPAAGSGAFRFHGVPQYFHAAPQRRQR